MPWLSGAVAGGKFGLAKFLLELGADPNQQDPDLDGSTPLMVVVRSPLIPAEKIKFCELLIDCGADLSLRRASDGRGIDDEVRQHCRSTRGWRRLQELLRAF